MRLKPKTVRRLLLLSVGLFLLAGMGVALVVVRKVRSEARLVARRTAGLEAAKANDSVAVVQHLAPYLRRHDDDPEALLAFARARRNIEDKEGKHLEEAAKVYQRYLGLRDADQEAHRELLSVLDEAGMDVETCDVARRLRPSNLADLAPAHLDVVRIELQARRRSRKVGDDTLALARRALELAPTDFTLCVLYTGLLLQADRPDDAARFIRDTGAALPNDPRVDLLRTLVDRSGPANHDRTVQTLCRVAGLDPATGARTADPADSSEALLALLVSGFDSAGCPHLALSALEPSARAGRKDSVQLFARRAFYLNQHARLVEVQAACAAEPSWQSSDVLAFTSLSLRALDRPDDADRLFSPLAAREGDFRASGWTAARPALGDVPDAALTSAIKALHDAIESDPIEPFLRLRLAELLARLGRTEDARAELAVLARSPLAAGWPRPGVLAAETLLTEQRFQEARRVCLEALRQFPDDLGVRLTLLAIKLDQLDHGYLPPAETKALLKNLTESLERLPQATSLSPRIRELLITGLAIAADAVNDPDALARAARTAVAAAPTLSPPALLRLADISRRRSLGIEDTLLARAREAGTSPTAVLLNALNTRRTDEPAARASITAELEQPAGGRRDDPAWQIIRPRFLEAINDPAAPRAWIELADRFPSDAGVQLAALQSRSLAAEPAAVERLAERFSAASGGEGHVPPVVVRLAQARALGATAQTAAARSRLIAALRRLTTDAPDLCEPRLLLADALLMHLPADNVTPDYPGALEQLRAAISLAPRPAAVRLRLAEVLRQSGDAPAGRSELLGVALAPDADPDSRWAAIDAITALAQPEQAASLARSLAQEPVESLTDARAVSLARVFTLAGRDADALRVYRQLASRDLAPALALDVATGLAGAGDTTAAETMLDRLASGARAAEYRRVRARLEAMRGRHAASQDLLTELVTANQKDTEAWRLLVAGYLSLNRPQDASRALAEALNANPDDPDLQLLSLEFSIRRGEVDTKHLAPVADALARRPDSLPRAEAIRAYAALHDDNRRPDAPALRTLGQRFQADPLIQSLVIADLLALQPPQLTAAAELSRTASRVFPTRWQTAADAYRVQRALGDWNAALEAAERWRQLSPTLASALAVAESQLQLVRPRQARLALEPYLATAQQNAEASVPVLRVWGAAAIAEDHAADARRVLEPLAASSPRVLREVWLDLAARRVPLAQAPTWIHAVEPLATTQGVESILAVAGAWEQLAQRDAANRAAHLRTAGALLESSSPGDARVLCAQGELACELDELDRAESLFHRAEGTPECRALALRGLAQVALARGKDPAAAAQAAQRAVDAFGSPGDVRAFRLLGDAHLAAADATPATARDSASRAAAAFASALALDPANPALLDRLAHALETAGRTDEAIAAYERLLALSPALISPRDLAASQNNLAYVLLTSRTDRAAHERARDLAAAAATQLPDAAVFDTLASAYSALGQREEAIATFRRSLTQRADSASTLAKLAELLASGSAAERTEARELISQAQKALLQSPRSDSPELQARIQKTRASLGLP